MSAPARSIKKKLILSSVTVLATALAGFLAAVIWINASLAARQKDASFESIRNALFAKGNILVTNNSQALQGMVADNGFLAVAGLVASTVRDDEDVVYGIFMDDKRQPWVFADSANPEGAIAAPGALDDTASLWASNLQGLAHRRLSVKGSEIFEFAAPVRSEDRILGVVRYGLTTSRMHAALASASRDSRQALARTIAALVFLGGLAALFTYLAARRQAILITRPIEELQKAANAIAGGDYARPVSISSDDEIGLLAADFDSMRRTVKEYTERLEDMVAEKIQEIKDILDNIEQGLFTVGLDGKVNPDYALSTNLILDVEDASRSTLAQLLRLDAAQEADWMDWLDMVRKRHGALRWEKLVRLCPVRELRLPDGGAGDRIILVGYQKMFDREKNFNKVMVLVQDVTDARRVERMIKEEKERHDNEVKAILGIVRYSAFIPDFLADVEARLRNLGGGVHRAPSAGGTALAELTAAMSRDLHTLKGTAATYGFESLSRLAREAEEALEELRRPNHPPVSDEWAIMARYVERLEACLAEIRTLVKSLAGPEAQATVPVPEPRIRELRALSASLRNGGPSGILAGAGREAPELLERLLRACRSIDHVKIEKLADKYRAMVQRVGERLGKRLEFRAVPEGMEVSPSLFAALDEPLVHLLRNAADHGIEMEATRLLHGKSGTGKIQLSLAASQAGWDITVSDDGHGIDIATLSEKALSKGLVKPEDLAAMDETAKQELIFLPGLSSRDQSTEISGMGVGMDAVAVWARTAGGGIKVSSQAGQGTRITLNLPIGFAEPAL
ncbi:MAG: Signal transduction histidine kinase CheA [Fibrobacteres bacterium]|nr:Signal transduction histidine kinase CheA [Fibrobacterota bacterium]